jgi:hypothetical protein
MTVTVAVEGIKDFQRYVDTLPEITRKSARMALNDTADTARKKLIPDAMRKEVAFPAGYLEDETRLETRSRATDGNLEVDVTGRARATSLARFVPGGAASGTRGRVAGVTVNPGMSVPLHGAFLVHLKSGASLTEDNFNLGLAVRLKPGQTLRNRHLASVQFADGLVLLYAPSVDQVFRTVAEDLGPQLGQMVEDEFLRQFVRLSDE